MKIPPQLVAALGVALAGACASAAPIPALFPTGVDGSGNLLAAGAADPHYTLITSDDPGAAGPATFVVNEGFPIGPWMANGAVSKWIAPMAAQGTGNAAGNYTYRLSFDLGGLRPETATISGQWSCDNAGLGVALNGNPTGSTHSGNFGAFEPFTISGGFVSGTNTLDFIVNNAGAAANPTGIRIELEGSAEVEPPPGTPPSISADPAGVTAVLGDAVRFNVAASGASPLAYQWRKDGTDIPGARSPGFDIAAVTTADAGSYDVVVSNPWGSATSRAARLEISLDLPSEAELEREPLGPSRRRSGLAFSEILYHPRARADGRDLEFIEIYNSNPWPEDLAGYRLGGEVGFTFPPGSEIPANGFAVVAAAPADIAAEYGIPAPHGPWSGSLSDAGGRLRLTKRSGGVILDLDYADDGPWPVAADGAGHALLLARPSFGEGDPRAWTHGAQIGGSPGQDEPPPASALEHVSISEIFASGAGDFIELHNRSFADIDLSGCRLSDDPATDRFTIPGGTVIAAGSFLHFDAATLGFALSSAGETILFKDPTGTRVIDALRFGGQAPGTAFGRSPDGNRHQLGELASPTPGAANAAPLQRPIVINEILFNPLHPGASEFVELFNRGAQMVDLGGWAFTAGIDFSFPVGTTVAPGGFVVVASDRQQLLADHPALDPAMVFGDFGGSLSDSGETLALAQPVALAGGGFTFATVDEVRYTDGGSGRRLADGGGSSLELIDPSADNRQPSNWSASDESAKAPWTIIEHTGLLELGKGTPDQLQLFLLDAGEALVDDVAVVPQGGSNRVTNPAFTSGANWFFQGSHAPSSITDGALHLRAVTRGDLGANRVRTPLSSALAPGTTATIRARARWLGGSRELLIRVLGNYLEVPATLTVPRNLGTPGSSNSRLVANAPPAITEVRHRPVLPAANEAVRLTARASDPDGLATLTLIYHADPSGAVVQLAMRDDGLGGDQVAGDAIFSAVIPGQPGGTLVAFHIEAADRHATAPAAARFPAGEGLVRWGDGDYPGGFANYRLWMTDATRTTWAAREKMSNQPLPITFVYADHRVVYEAGAHYSGSAYTSPGYDSPTGRVCGYDITFPRDQPLLGDDGLTLDFPVRDPTAQREQLMYWFCDQSGLPNNYRRYVNVFVNGTGQRQRPGWGGSSNAIYTDIQQPNSDTVDEWFRGETGGHLVKGSYWHEFDDGGARIEPATTPTLEIFNSSAGGKQLARYRWNWRLRALDGSANDYSEIFRLADALAVPGAGLVPAAHATIDIDQWMRTLVVNDLAANWDSFGNPGGKNTFHYRPPSGRWQLMSWDFDVGLGVFNDPVDAALFSLSDPAVQRLLSTPELRRHYWHAMREAVDSFFQGSAVAPVLDPKWAALQAAGVPVTSPNLPSGQANLSIPDWIDQRRQFLLGQLATVEAPFQITTNGGADFSTADPLIVLEGSAPMSVHALELDASPLPVEWIGVNAWRARIARPPGTHTLTVSGIDRDGMAIAGASDRITVTVTGGGDDPQGNLVINEIMYHPANGGSEFLELHNRSATSAFDLGGWRLNGLGLTFPAGSVIAPGGFLVVAENRQSFGTEFGWEIPVATTYPGSLDNRGEAITLLQPGTGPGDEIEADRVRYSPDLPWPAPAAGTGASLQLADPSRDNARAANWFAAPADAGSEPGVLVPMTANWRYNQAGFVPLDWNQPSFDASAWPAGDALLYVESADLPAPKNTPLSLGPTTFYFRTTFRHDGPPGASLALSTIIDDGAAIYLNGSELLRLRLPAGTITANTFATPFVGDATLEGPLIIPAPSLVTGDNVLAVEVHQSVSNSSDLVMGVEVAEAGSIGLAATPGAANLIPSGSNPDTAPLWLNELSPSNDGSITDSAGDSDPWLEIFNAGTSSASLEGWFLSDDPAQPDKWPFPAASSIGGGSFVLVWLDGEPAENAPGEAHTNFSAPATGGRIFLSFAASAATAPRVVDALAYQTLASSRSLGRFPDADPNTIQEFATPTPGAPNDRSIPLPPITINEWMAANNQAFPDPADGDFDDWFELHNAGAQAVDLSGFTLTDDLAIPNKFQIPGGTSIGAGGFLLVWADDEVAQTRPGGDLHVNFKLGAAGESIALFAPDGNLVDAVTFGAQAADTSQGRWPDGAGGGSFFTQSSATPGNFNDLTPPGPVLIPNLEIAWDGPRDGLILRFTTEFGRYYLVQFSADLQPGNWQNEPQLIVGTGGMIEFALGLPRAPARFYRIAILTTPH